MNKVSYVALPTEVAEYYRAGGFDANGQKPETHISTGSGLPCRHCLDYIEEGEPYLILAHRPFPDLHPYAELGPIFLHAEGCERHKESDGIPKMFLEWETVLVKGYGRDDRIVYGTGEIVESGRIEDKAHAVLAEIDVAYAHIRSAKNNCFMCRVE